MKLCVYECVFSPEQPLELHKYIICNSGRSVTVFGVIFQSTCIVEGTVQIF